MGTGDGNELSISELLAGLGPRQKDLGGVHAALDSLVKKPALQAPLPRLIKERQERKAAYEHTKGELKKWDDIVEVSWWNL